MWEKSQKDGLNLLCQFPGWDTLYVKNMYLTSIAEVGKTFVHLFVEIRRWPAEVPMDEERRKELVGWSERISNRVSMSANEVARDFWGFFPIYDPTGRWPT